ncbi:riboflavin synthase [Sphingomonas sp. HDW15A]|uniref:riboflavin synthase n=1 Tax=Sphingomonas sp. HDW15A TaxID=2714942 RepID=UPI00140BFFFA|nr:riboflavin synthase [Sphingomonas sp. HDW15A]QIK97004.1 riboflavin synthase [Sphingomonas sp. HDW15A]
MFTGIVTEVGNVREAREDGDLRLTVATAADLSDVDLGASIACSGVCLTVVGKGDDWFSVDVSNATRDKTVPDHWQAGASLNLERALRLGDELGGHFVTGHVDGVAEVIAIRPEGGSMEVEFAAERRLGKFIACKGSITIDGVSLTVNEVSDNLGDGTTRFTANIIPHTADHTTLGSLAPNHRVNLEIDVLARYLQRLEDSRRECD